MAKYAAIGTDGRRRVYWGLGDTEAEARADAVRWLAESGCEAEMKTLEIVEVTEAQAKQINDGDVDVAS